MLYFPFSLLLLPLAALFGIAYVSLGSVRSRRVRSVGRVVLLAALWASPLATRGPGAAQLTLGLLVGFLGIRMVALAERWKYARVPPSPGKVLAVMLTPEELMTPAPLSAQSVRGALTLLGGCAAVVMCVGLLVLGNKVRLWHWSRFADDLLVFAEVAIGTSGVHAILVGAAGLTGHSVVGLQDRPITSASFCQFWARRWNHLVQGNLDRGFFRPYARRRQWARGTLAAFTASGIMHVIAVLDTESLDRTVVPAGAVMAFFLISAALVLAERHLGWHRQPQKPAALFWARLRTVATLILLSPLLLDPFASVVHLHGRRLGGW